MFGTEEVTFKDIPEGTIERHIDEVFCIEDLKA